MAAVSAVMRALYSGRRADAEAAAGDGHDLTVFEAAALGRDDALARVLTTDADAARARSDDGFLAIHYACFFGTPACTAALLDAGAPLDEPSRNDMGVRPVNAAAAGPHPVDQLRLLLERGADVNGRQASGHTALDEARSRDLPELIDLLEGHGAA